MDVPLATARETLDDLVQRAEAGEEVVLTRDGRPSVQLVPVSRKPTREAKLKMLKELRGAAKGLPEWEGVTAATAADFLYDDETGLPA